MKQPLLFLASAALLGCGTSVKFTRAGPTLPAKPDTCEVAVLAAAPAEAPYTELGTIHIEYHSQTAWIDKEPAFKKRIQPLVCQAGGDAAIAHRNDYGLYLKATVLSLQPVASAPAATTAQSEPTGSGDETADSDKLP